MTGLPPAVRTAVEHVLAEAGDHTAIARVSPVGGGCINHAMCLETSTERYFLKWNGSSPPGMFSSEAKGLAMLAETGTVRVPEVLAVSENEVDHPAFLLTEWVEVSRGASQAVLGEQLANLHHKGTSPLQPPAYGLDHNNYLGSTAQVNQWDTDWGKFFASHRLRPQMELARQLGRLTPPRDRRLERLIDRIPVLLGSADYRPALIHGDLWAGNVLDGPDGPVLIDPAVSYSDREAEIAYTELFGGFTDSFYQAYEAIWPLEPGYRDRRDLYQLYHLLNHLNLFGESYGGHVDAVLRRYAG